MDNVNGPSKLSTEQLYLGFEVVHHVTPILIPHILHQGRVSYVISCPKKGELTCKTSSIVFTDPGL